MKQKPAQKKKPEITRHVIDCTFLEGTEPMDGGFAEVLFREDRDEAVLCIGLKDSFQGARIRLDLDARRKLAKLLEGEKHERN